MSASTVYLFEWKSQQLQIDSKINGFCCNSFFDFQILFQGLCWMPSCCLWIYCLGQSRHFVGAVSQWVSWYNLPSYRPAVRCLSFSKAGSCGRVAAADCSASVVLEVLVWTCLRHMIHNDINNAAHTHAFQSCLCDWHNSSHPVSHPGVRFHAFCTVWVSAIETD